jgi:hypothetical protein
MNSVHFSGRPSVRALQVSIALVSFGISGLSYAQGNIGAQIGTQQDVVRQGQQGTVEQQVQFRLTDPDVGEIDVVSRTPRPKMFTFSTDQNLFYTTNAFLEDDPESSDFFWNGRFVASFVPYSTVNFTPRLTFEQSFFRYDRFGVLDFDSQLLRAEIKYDFNRNDSWFMIASYEAARQYSWDDDVGEFYRYGLLNASINHVHPCRDHPVEFRGSLGTNWRHGDPSEFDRITGYANFGVLYSPIPTIHVGAYVHPEVQFYLNDPNDESRTDFNISAGAGVTWTPRDWISFGVNASVTGNYSSADNEDYKVFLPSIVVAGGYAF